MTHRFSKRINDVFDILMDLRFGVNTRKYNNIKYLKKGFNDYEPTPYKILISIFQNIDINKNDVFVDVGCGLGRVLIIAIKAGFRKVVGLDIDENAVEICKCNLMHITLKNTKVSYNIFNVSSENFQVINSYNTFFFFNPFELKYFIKFIRKLDKLENINVIIFCPTEGYLKYMDTHRNYILDKILNYNEFDIRYSAYIYRKI